MPILKTSRPLKISRANLQLMKECPRCFWLYKHKNINRPQGYPYTLSIAVDQLLKAEFDTYREKGIIHPILAHHAGLEKAKLFTDYDQLKKWRNNFEGLKYHDEELDATLFGAVDDMLEFPDGRLAVIDYKSSGAKEISVYEDYQMQMDVYAHILEHLGFKTVGKGYFVFYKVQKDKGFAGDAEARLPFCGEIREVTTDPSYVHDLFAQAVELARSEITPPPAGGCQYCQYVEHHKHLD